MDLETSDIQAIIVTGYRHLPWSRYLFLHVDDASAARRWLFEVAPSITVANWERNLDGKALKPSSAVNIAFTFEGLIALGLKTANSFPEEFVQGMAEQARARRLGDNGDSHPAKWEFGGSTESREQTIHILLMLEVADENALDMATEKARELVKKFRGLHEVYPSETGRPLCGQKEHFGFHDSISQPEIEGTPKQASEGRDLLKAGEFLLGYLNEYGVLPPTPVVTADTDIAGSLPDSKSSTEPANNPPSKDFGRNGSYLVFRKLQQDVAGFRGYIRANSDSATQDLLGAKMVGRWPSGTPLVQSPLEDKATPDEAPSNDFLYAQSDPHGISCPLGAHIRRTNPRDSLENRDPAQSLTDVRRHRILRRGAAYGVPLPENIAEDDKQPRGLLFICVNADIKRQFEFIQQTWANNPKFHGLYDDRDPLIGDNVDPTDDAEHLAPRTFTIQREGVRTRLTSIPRFVTMKGGAYFFLPSVSALYYLARATRPK